MKHNLFDLTGQVALCCGGSSGLGFQFAKALANAGADIALVARRLDRLRDNAALIEREYGVRCYVHEMDYKDTASVTKTVEDVLAHYGRIDILSNAGGSGGSGDSATITDEQWRSVVDCDLNGQYWICREVARLAMIPQNYGRIVNVSSIHAMVSRIRCNTNAYMASKGGIASLSRDLASMWGKYNIMVNVIAPGYFPTELTSTYIDSPAFDELHKTHCPVGRHARIEEMDGLVVYLSSPCCSYTTGQHIAVDGGYACC